MEILKTLRDGRLLVAFGDITRYPCDAIVNAANSTLLGGGGVDGAIHEAAGPDLLAECKRLRATSLPEGLPPGQAVATGPGKLSALGIRRIIHTVGPIWRGGNHDEPRLLASCYRSCLEIARAENFSSIAFPAISTGVYGFPKSLAAPIAFRAVADFLDISDRPATVTLVFYSRSDAEIFLANINS